MKNGISWRSALVIAIRSCLLTAHLATALGGTQIQYQSPTPGATLVSPQTNIIIRLSEMIEASSIQPQSLFEVRGTKSGIHQGEVILSDDQSTVIFKPDQPFSSLETVSVTVRDGLRTLRGVSAGPLFFRFTIAPDKNRSVDERTPIGSASEHVEQSTWASKPPSSEEGITRTSSLQSISDSIYPLDLPYLKTLVRDSPERGRVFLSNVAFSSSVANTPYLLILDDSSALPLFYRRMHSDVFDFKVQPDGRLTYFDNGVKRHYVMDSSYAVVDSFEAGNGYTTDLHEFQELLDGHVLLMSYDTEAVDMSSIVPGGKSSARVVGLIVQELDKAKNVAFQWRSWDHFQITDATHENLTASIVDYVHGNALELDTDGNFLLSNRHMDEITKISRQTGEIIWRFGGKNNQFAFLNDSIGFSHQHAVRRLANGDITLFDNGNFHSTPFSRAVEYRIDEQNKTATLVWEYRHSPNVFGAAMGYMQRLPGGNTLIGWDSSNPSVTEVRPDRSVAYELTLDNGIFSYRAYKFPWKMNAPSSPQPSPSSFTLYPNYPNPFNSSTTIRIGISQPSIVNLVIYDQLGQAVAMLSNNQLHDRGEYEVVFNLLNLPS